MKRVMRICMLIMVLSVAVVLVVGNEPLLAKEVVSKEFQLALENDSYKLYFNPTTAEAVLEDQKTKQVWYTNPQGVEDQEQIIAFNKNKLKSQLIVEVVNQQNIVETALSELESVKKNKFSYEIQDNQLIVNYEFEKHGLMIPLTYELIPNGVKAYVESDGIVEGETYRLTKVAILPYFGAAQQGTEGYILLPDGSGAIMAFDAYKNSNIYTSKVYGRDLSLTNDTAPNKDERIMLPLFGLKREKDGILGIITKGEETASIVAQQALPNSGYNYAYANFETRVLNYYYLEEKDPGRSRKVPYISEALKANECYEVQYHILPEAQSDYVGMAKYYQSYLVGQGLLPAPKEGNQKLITIDVYGGVNVDSVIMGIPVVKFLNLTTFEQCKQILNDMKAAGVNELSMRYRGWEKDGLVIQGASQTIKPASSLGGKKQMDALKKLGKENEVPIYFETDLITYAPRKFSFGDLQKTIKNVGNYYAYQYTYDLPTKEIDKTIERTLLISPKALVARVAKVLPDLEENIALKGIADLVYHDSHKQGGSIRNTTNVFTEQLGKIEEGRSVLLESPNMYGLKYADLVVNVPVYSSNYMNFTNDVPFYQLVLQGYVDYFTPYINRNANPQEMLLKAIESGSGIHFGGSYEDPTILLNTPYNGLMISKYDSWKDLAIASYKALENIEEITQGSEITMHEAIEKGVIQVGYQNGTKIIINYNDDPIQYNGSIVPPKEYLILHQ